MHILTAEKEANIVADVFFKDATLRSPSDVKADQVLGLPRVIETNGEGYGATVTLPLFDLSQEQLTDPSLTSALQIFLEYGDGTVLIDATLLYDGGMPHSIRFDTSRFGRFQIVSMEKVSATWSWTWVLVGAAGLIILLGLSVGLVIVRKRNEEK